MARGRRWIVWTIAVFVVATATLGTSVMMAEAQDVSEPQTRSVSGQRPILVMVDTSSSMSETDGAGKIRIEGAKEALALLVERLPPLSRLGVWTYPASNCDPGQLQTNGYPSVAALNVENITERWQPDGNTPTAEALRAAAQNLTLAGGTTIVLISDGESNCSADPCAAARQLADEGIEVKFDTVGFQISAAGREELQCIAEATGGTYRDVEDSEELIEAIQDVTVTSLGLVVSTPVEVMDAADVGFPRSVWSVSADVSVEGEVDANDLALSIRFTGDRRPVLFDATRLLPHLPAGATHTVTWQVSAPVDCGYAIPFEVVARARDAEPVSRERELVIPGGESLACLIADEATDITIIGDSYSSGEGAPPYDDDTDNGSWGSYWNECRRGQTYGRTATGDQISVVACSGAIIHDMLVAHTNYNDPDDHAQPLPAQLRQLLDLLDEENGNQVVMLSLSGNDIWFADIIKAAIAPRFSKFDSFTQAADFAKPSITGVAEPLLRSLRMIESTVNQDRQVPVQFVILPYVQAIPGEDFPEDPDDCPLGANWAGKEVDRKEALKFETLRTNLNTVIENAAFQLTSDGRPVHFARSVWSAFADHTVCDEEPWSNAVQVGDNHESLHPNNAGHQAIWETLLADAQRWPVLDRDPEVAEMVVSDGELCSTKEAIHARIVELTGNTEVTRGECVWVVGRADLETLLDAGDTGSPSTSITDFASGTSVDIYLESTPQLVGRSRISETGEFRELVWIPDDLPRGEHRLSATLVSPAGFVELGSVEIALVDHSADPFRIAVWFFAGLLLIGIGVVVLSRGGSQPS